MSLIRRILPVIAGLLLLASWADAQEPQLQWDTAVRPAPVAMLGLKPLYSLVDGRRLAPLASLAERPSFQDWLGDWEAATQARLAQVRAASLGARDTLVRANQAVEFLPPPRQPALAKAARDTTEGGEGLIGAAVSEVGELGMSINGRAEMGGAWTRYSPCDPGLQINCNPSLFPQLRPDIQFGIKVGGTISERIHVNVDYDQRREFDAANNLNVYYQGLDDEILQRLEVGDVSIRLPASRYLTQGVPAGNFGFQATGQLGPIDFQAIWAQQRGDVTTREFRLAGGGNTQGLVQDETLVMDDADYVKGQFFFLVHPDTLAGAPHIDALALRSSDAPVSLRPRSIEIYRDERPSVTNQQQQAQISYFLAEAVSADGVRRHTGMFKRLLPGEDYIVHASGLWIMLRAPLRADEALAVSYVSESGANVGTPNAEASPPGTTPTLLMLRGPTAIHQPADVTWNFEMHQVYRVHSSNTVDLATVQLRISLGELSGGRTFANAAGQQVPLIRLFGLDEDAPADALDVAQVFQPGRDGFGETAGSTARITGTYIFFPTLRPFMEPAAVPSANLSAAEAQAALGAEANDVIYENNDPVLRDSGGRFRLNFTYRVHVEGLVSSFNLGAFGIREGSERISMGGRTLQQGVDYSIDYEIGLVSLMDAQSLFATNPGAEIRATWEQKSMFEIAPTSVFGLNARYSLGTRGELNFVGLYQAEKTIMSRPQLGTEPSAIFLGGASGRLDLGGGLLDRALSFVPGLRVGALSAINLTGEVALSLPNPNTRNEAYVEDFEAADELRLSMVRRGWQLGSAPDVVTGNAANFLPATLLPDNAARLVWQHDILQDGQLIGPILPSTIDKQIVIAGNQVPEAVLWLTFGDAQRPLPGRRWRSMTAVLSTTGTDLTRSEYLEVYVKSSGNPGQALILDLGTVSEDAFYFNESGDLQGTYDEDLTPWGRNILDAEARLAEREIWGLDTDARGLWDQNCTGTRGEPVPLGNIAANCARGNGLLDTEDLDGNGLLDATDGTYHRYVVPLDDASSYLVRDRTATGTQYQLFRIPLRSGEAINGATEATWRFVKHLRMTVATDDPNGTTVENIVLARMRIVGSRWVKRDIEGVNRGLVGDEEGISAQTAEVRVGPVSRLTHGADYTPPPFIRDQLQDPSQGIGATGIEFNEKSLSVAYTALGADDRAEVFFRYPQQPRSFLNYRHLKLWAVAREGSFGAGGDQRLVVKVGTDQRNYYLFQTRLNPAVGDRPITASDWEPEITVDFEKWFDLKAQAELDVITNPPPPGQPYVKFNEDSSYAIVLEDRGRAPNMAAIRELSFAIYNAGIAPADGEVWINDVRLGAAFKDPGVAGNVTLDIRGGDFLSASVSYANQGPLFRQLNQEASYLAAGDFSVNTSAQLGQLLPAGLNLDMPLTVTHARSGRDPTLLDRSDVRAADLPGLRETASDLTRVGLSIRKRTPSANAFVAALIDPVSVRVGYNTGQNSAITARNEASGLDATLAYNKALKARDFDVMPSFLEAALRFLAPAAIENSAFFKRLAGARLRWTPERLTLSGSYFGQERRAFQYNQILVNAADSAVIPIESPRRTLDTDATLTLKPFNSLSANLALRTARDLLPTERASVRAAERSAIGEARSNVAGLDVGWETQRSLTSQLNFRPEIADWLRPGFVFSARFGTDRSPSYLRLITSGSDTTALLERRFQSDRQVQRTLDIHPYGLFRRLLPDTTGFARTLHMAVRSVASINLRWNSALGSRFERELIEPGLGYQFGLGDLASFRHIGVDSAIATSETGRFEAQTVLRMWRGTQFDLGYSSVDVQGFDQHGGSRTSDDVTWPRLRLTWADLPIPQGLRRVIPRASITAGYERRSYGQLLGFGTQSDRGEESANIPLNINMNLAGGVVAAYTATWLTGERDDPTGDAEKAGMSHNLNVSATFKPPEALSTKLTHPLRATLGMTQNSQNECRFRVVQLPGLPPEAGCVPFIDYTNRTVNFSLDTVLSELIVGLQLSYTGRQDNVGMRRGSSQFQLGLFGQFDLNVGQLPAAAGGLR